jgi:type 1 glutamine amidotransferase
VLKRQSLLWIAAVWALSTCWGGFSAGTNPVCAQDSTAKKRVVFLAGPPSHGYGAHEHHAGCVLLAKHLEQAMPNFEVKVYKHEWPADPKAFEGADCVVMYSDGGGGHPVMSHLKEIDALADKGVGIVCLHYAVEIPKGEPGDKFLKWIGGYFETDWSVNPHWVAKFEKLPEHPVSRGVKPFEIEDEWYYHMRFRPEMKGVTPILSAIPPASTHRGQTVRTAAIRMCERKQACRSMSLGQVKMNPVDGDLVLLAVTIIGTGDRMTFVSSC